MSKYQPLETYLRSRNTEEVPVTFEEIEAIIGAKLPPVAHAHRAWWSNNPSNNVMTKAWLAAGFQSERVDIGARKLVFRRTRADRPTPGLNSPDRSSAGSARKPLLDTLWGSLAGTVHVPDGVDLTEPTGAVWDAERR
jgi:hypothetical protein